MTHDTDTKSDATPDSGARVDAALLAVLVCPITHGPLEYDAANGELISHQAGKAFPIRDGVPVMLVEEARSLDDTQV